MIGSGLSGLERASGLLKSGAKVTLIGVGRDLAPEIETKWLYLAKQAPPEWSASDRAWLSRDLLRLREGYESNASLATNLCIPGQDGLWRKARPRRIRSYAAIPACSVALDLACASGRRNASAQAGTAQCVVGLIYSDPKPRFGELTAVAAGLPALRAFT